MRRRLERFLPIVVLALVMQILAPIAASWAAGITVPDPLQSAGICHSDGPTGSGDQNREPYAHDGLCAICIAHAGTAVGASKPLALVVLAHLSGPVFWTNAELTLRSSRVGSNTQARAPPRPM